MFAWIDHISAVTDHPFNCVMSYSSYSWTHCLQNHLKIQGKLKIIYLRSMTLIVFTLEKFPDWKGKYVKFSTKALVLCFSFDKETINLKYCLKDRWLLMRMVFLLGISLHQVHCGLMVVTWCAGTAAEHVWSALWWAHPLPGQAGGQPAQQAHGQDVPWPPGGKQKVSLMDFVLAMLAWFKICFVWCHVGYICHVGCGPSSLFSLGSFCNSA